MSKREGSVHGPAQAQEYIALGLLMKGPLHGYAIHRRFVSGPGRVWYTGMSQLYALLKSLEAEGMVVSSVEAQAGKPARKVYALTPAGRKAFRAWVKVPVAHIRDMRLELLVKLMLMKELGLAGIPGLLAAQERVCRGLLDESRGRDVGAEDGLDRLIARFRAGQVEAVLGWLGECRAYFGQGGER